MSASRSTMLRATIALAALVSSGGGIAAGERAGWISLEPSTAEAGERVAVRLMYGDGFGGREQPFRDETGVRFQHLWKGGRADLGIVGGMPAARLLPAEPGVHLVSHGSAAATPEQYTKALLVVAGATAGSPLHWSELGHRLEIVPQTDPVELLARGGTLELQVLWEREPLADATVSAIARANPGSVLRARSDEIGLVSFELDRPGTWLIQVAREGRAHASLTLVAGPPQAKSAAIR